MTVLLCSSSGVECGVQCRVKYVLYMYTYVTAVMIYMYSMYSMECL